MAESPPRLPVFRTAILITVLHEARDLDTARAEITSMRVHDILSEMDDGSFIGATRWEATREIPPAEVRTELLAIGNDGTFFEDEEGV